MSSYAHLYICGVVLITAVLDNVKAQEKYTTKYDNIDLDQILHTDRLLKNYVDCLLDRGSCTPDGRELKKTMPDAIETDCSKCSERQKEGSDQIIHFLIDHRPEYWKPLQEKYDAADIYKKRYLESKSQEVKIEPAVSE